MMELNNELLKALETLNETEKGLLTNLLLQIEEGKKDKQRLSQDLRTSVMEEVAKQLKK